MRPLPSTPRSRTALLTALLAAGLAAASVPAGAQDGPAPPADAPKSKDGGPPPGSPAAPPAGGARELMWQPPTAEDWKKPVLIAFQRTWEDAVAVSKETGKAILVCVNMDGEIASEHYAGVRYRQADIAKLYEPYVCVIASVYRHSPRDHDDEGRRILCPRFGSVTCGEHIALEPIVYEKYLDGKRIAPRHIMVELDGAEVYDVYYANDTASVFQTIQDGIAKRATTPPPVVRGDRPMVERVASRDAADRVAVESAYGQGDAASRKALLDAAAANAPAAPVDLLRLAIFGLDPELAASARKALAQSDTTSAIGLLDEALRVPMADAEREALVGALERIGQTSRRAQILAVVHRGLSSTSGTIDATAWAKTLEAAAAEAPPPKEFYELEDSRQRREAARRAAPEDPAAALEFAEASLDLARRTANTPSADAGSSRAFAKLLYEDARRGAEQAEKLGATGWRVHAVRAIAAYKRGDVEDAYAEAEKAVKDLPEGEPSWNAMAVLTVFGEARFQAIKKAVKERKQWPGQWLSDVNAAYAVLLRHPHGTDAQVVWHYDFLDWIGARHRASRVLDDGLGRFPESTQLHGLLRARVLRERGPEGLETWYETRLRAEKPPAELVPFAAEASVLAAEFHRRGGSAEKALASYERALAHLDRAAADDPERIGEFARRAALVLAGRARMAYERGDDEPALRDVLASFERDPSAAGSLDGLGFTPASTAQALLARLVEGKRTEQAQKLEAAMAKLDPTLLVPKNE